MVTSPAPAVGYGRTAKALHWLVFALVAVQFVVAIAMPNIGRGTKPGTLINLHMSLGFTILAVILVRWLWRIGHPVPLVTTDVPEGEAKVAGMTHKLLYALLVVNPFLGWANASARDWDIVMFGQSMPHLVAAQSRIGRLAGDVHVYLGWSLLMLIGLHVAAALYHHFGRHDRVLQRMLPGASR